jgi:hypothetical protein
MKTTLLLGLVVLTGCSTPDTVCGQFLDTSMSDWLTVEALQEAETAFVGGALLVIGDSRLSGVGSVCKWLQGARVVPMPSPTWVDSWGRTVAGLSYPAKDWSLTWHVPGGVVVIGRQSEGTWRSSALVHEWVHLVQGSIPAPPCSQYDDAHCGWSRVGGEYALIDALSH